MRNKRGFTLIEILVVIAIIGILAAFFVVPILGSQDRTREASVKGVMQNVQLGIEAYNVENEVYPIATNITLRNLYDNYLSVGGYLTTLPKDPFTNEPYKENDVAGKIMYTYDSATGAYTLTGYKRNGTSRILELTNM